MDVGTIGAGKYGRYGTDAEVVAAAAAARLPSAVALL